MDCFAHHKVAIAAVGVILVAAPVAFVLAEYRGLKKDLGFGDVEYGGHGLPTFGRVVWGLGQMRLLFTMSLVGHKLPPLPLKQEVMGIGIDYEVFAFDNAHDASG